MALLTSPYNLVTSINEDCIFHVQDLSGPFPIGGGPTSPDQLAIALFWTPGMAGAGTWDGDLSNPSSREWFVTPYHSGDYTFHAFYIPVYNSTSAVVLNQGEIRFSNDGHFYILTALTYTPLGNPLPQDSASWTLLTILDYSDFEASAVLASLTDWGYLEDTNYADCNRVTINMLDCYSYEICLGTVAGTLIGEIFAVNDLTTPIATFTPVSGDCITIDDLPDDGVYLFQITQRQAADVVIYRGIVYEFCSYKECMQNLIDQILCNEWDPCCTTCSDEQRWKMQIRRDHLNMMIALFADLYGLLNVNWVYCIENGIINPSEQELEQIVSVNSYRIAQILARLNQIIERCGECYSAVDEDTTTPCSNC